MLLKEYFLNLFSEPGFMGALLGALLSSVVALVILFLQIRSNKRLHLKKEYGEYYKNASILILLLENFMNKLSENSIEKLVNIDDSLIQSCLDSINELLDYINSIKQEDILPDIYIHFNIVKD